MDRQDIDALLIGALYGELTPADEARLAAHLESHPTDRGVLDDLKSARHAVRESRIFDLQLDPPQSVSALLLQEAHRRAPKRAAASEDRGESWFFRVTKMFLAHPAMAAAAMLVLVVGVAGTLYMRKGSDQFAAKEVAQPQLAAPNQEVAATPPADELAKNEGADTGLHRGGEGVAAGSAYNVQLDDKAAREQEDRLAFSQQQAEVAKLKAQQDALERQNKKTAIVVNTPRPEPKELDEQPRAKAAPAKVATSKTPAKGAGGGAYDRYDSSDNRVLGGAGDSSVVVGGAGGAATGSTSGRGATAPSGAASGPARNAPAPAAPPPPPPAAAPAPTTIAQGAAKPTAPAKKSVAKEAESADAPAEVKQDAAPAKDSALIAWAKTEHSRALQLASKGDCSGAAKAAVLISNRAPAYYSQFVATDRGLKNCQTYIAAERDADAKRAGKAQKRTTADEPATR